MILTPHSAVLYQIGTELWRAGPSAKALPCRGVAAGATRCTPGACSGVRAWPRTLPCPRVRVYSRALPCPRSLLCAHLPLEGSHQFAGSPAGRAGRYNGAAASVRTASADGDDGGMLRAHRRSRRGGGNPLHTGCVRRRAARPTPPVPPPRRRPPVSRAGMCALLTPRVLSGAAGQRGGVSKAMGLAGRGGRAAGTAAAAQGGGGAGIGAAVRAGGKAARPRMDAGMSSAGSHRQGAPAARCLSLPPISRLRCSCSPAYAPCCGRRRAVLPRGPARACCAGGVRRAQRGGAFHAPSP